VAADRGEGRVGEARHPHDPGERRRVFDDTKALFATAGSVVSDVTAPANLHWLNGDPSGIRIKLLTGAGSTMKLELGVSCP